MYIPWCTDSNVYYILSCVCVYIYICICMYTCVYIYTYIYIYIHILIYIYTYMHTHTYIYIYIYIHIHVHTHLRICIYVYYAVYMCIHTYACMIILTRIILNREPGCGRLSGAPGCGLAAHLVLALTAVVGGSLRFLPRGGGPNAQWRVLHVGVAWRVLGGGLPSYDC